MEDKDRNDDQGTTNSTTGSSSEEPKQDLLGNDAVWTPEIDALSSSVARWIRLDLPGATVLGKQRCGKTWACSYLAATIASLVGYPVVIFIWEIPSGNNPNERAFYQDRLIDSGCLAYSHRDIPVLRKRLFQHIAEFSHQSQARRVLVIVDDAQNLLNAHYEMLTYCFNRLEKLKLRPFFLLVGQPELRDVPKWAEVGSLGIIGRFFLHIHPFGGIRLADLEEVLGSFVLTPQIENLTSSAMAIIAEAASGGWNLAAIATPMREAIYLLLARQNIAQEIRLPMQYLRACALSVLEYIVENKVPPSSISTALLLQCLNDSGFPAVILFYIENS